MMHKAEKLSVCWRYHAGHGALIWQLMFTSTGNLIGQKRFAGSRQALFFGIDTATGSIFCDDFLLMDHIHPFSETETGLPDLKPPSEILFIAIPVSLTAPSTKEYGLLIS